MEDRDAIVAAYAHLEGALFSMGHLDLVKGYDLAKHKMEAAMNVLAATGAEVPIRKGTRLRKGM